MRRLIAVVGLLACCGTAQADGPHKWTSVYFGVHGGYGWGSWDGGMIYTDASHGDGFDGTGKVIDGEGALAGGQLGFNVQTGSFVWGVEGDLSWSGLTGSKRLLPYPVGYPGNGSPAWDFDNQINWSWTLKAEYLYVNLGSVGGILAGEQTTSCNPACPHTTDGFGGDLDVHTVRVGVNYRFGASD